MSIGIWRPTQWAAKPQKRWLLPLWEFSSFFELAPFLYFLVLIGGFNFVDALLFFGYFFCSSRLTNIPGKVDELLNNPSTALTLYSCSSSIFRTLNIAQMLTTTHRCPSNLPQHIHQLRQTQHLCNHRFQAFASAFKFWLKQVKWIPVRQC